MRLDRRMGLQAQHLHSDWRRHLERQRRTDYGEACAPNMEAIIRYETAWGRYYVRLLTQ